MKLQTKILAATGLPLLLLVMVVAALLLQRLYTVQLDMAKKAIQAEADSIALTLEGQNALTVSSAAALALAQQNGMFGRRAESIELARAMLNTHPEFTGTYLCYEPAADDPLEAGEQPVDPRAVDSNGRFLPYWFRSDSGVELEPNVHMESSYYYRGLRNRFFGVPEAEGIELENGISKFYDLQRLDQSVPPLMITEPYLYEGKLLIEQTAPIIIDGKFKGIAGIDRALTELADLLRGRRKHESTEFLLVSTRGRIIVASADAGLRTLPLEQTPYAKWLEPLYVERDFARVQRLSDPRTGATRFVAAADIPTGRWTLVTSVDEAEILGPVITAVSRTLLIIVAGLVLIACMVFMLTRAVVARVERAARAVEQVAAGDLTVEVESKASDETGALLTSLGHMVQALSGLVGRMRGSTDHLIDAAKELAKESSRQDEASSEIGASTTQIAASTTEISATAQELLSVMRETAEASAQASGVAAEGRSDIALLQSTMEALMRATTAIASQLELMARHAESIGSVVGTINNVADQTNLLSLNAAIEAEKAGEYGSGFAVVAREIRRLADQTAVATLDIEHLVQEVQGSVSTGVAEMSEFTENVRAGVNEVTQLSGQLAQIIEVVESLKPRLDAAYQGMEAQAAGAEQISKAMQQLRGAMQSPARSRVRMRTTAEELQFAVDELNDEIARFRTR